MRLMDGFRLMGVLAALALAAPAAAQPCGSEGPACAVLLGQYRILTPQTPAPPPPPGYPALLFFHGAGGTDVATLASAGFAQQFLDRGFAVIAPQGLQRPGSSFGAGWSFLPSRPQQRNELAFAREVLDDAAARHGIDRARVLVGGFSIGASLTWYLACADPALGAGYVPVAGAFWREHPAPGSCAGPVRLLHTHGWRDETVPLEGRPLRSGVVQGDVFRGLELLRIANGCDGLRADAYDTDGPYWRRWWTRCTPGSALEFALHTGGHGVPDGWADLALDWFARVEEASAVH